MVHAWNGMWNDCKSHWSKWIEGYVTVAERAQHAANAHNTPKKTNALQIEKNTCKLRKHFRHFDNAHAAKAHNTPKKETRCKQNVFVCVVSICTICCQTDENVFLISGYFFYLHVFSEVAARWALSATVRMFFYRWCPLHVAVGRLWERSGWFWAGHRHLWAVSDSVWRHVTETARASHIPLWLQPKACVWQREISSLK